ncbi:hypothetical protein GQ457_14G026020 [Hibiscus cannabinus]
MTNDESQRWTCRYQNRRKEIVLSGLAAGSQFQPKGLNFRLRQIAVKVRCNIAQSNRSSGASDIEFVLPFQSWCKNTELYMFFMQMKREPPKTNLRRRLFFSGRRSCGWC